MTKYQVIRRFIVGGAVSVVGTCRSPLLAEALRQAVDAPDQGVVGEIRTVCLVESIDALDRRVAA